MGFAIAEQAARRGARTTLVSGPVSLATPPGVERIDVLTALEMRDAIYELAESADLIVMTAAVGDFRPTTPLAQKHKKTAGIPAVDLTRNPDILAGLAELAPDTLRVGFAAETGGTQAEARAKMERKRADFLVWNDVSKKGIGFGADDNEVTVYRPTGEPLPISRRPKLQLAGDLLDLFSEAMKSREHPVADPVG